MNKVQILQFQERLGGLKIFLSEPKPRYTESVIIDWISDCVNLFYEIGVNDVIVENFLNYFQSSTQERENRSMTGETGREIVDKIGPFQAEKNRYLMTTIENTGKYILTGSLYYPKIAFSAAQSILKGNLLEKKLVPMWLTDEVEKIEHLRHLYSSFELIEEKYEAKDSNGLIAESVTLLTSVLNLDEDLKKNIKLGGKLHSLIENVKKRENFGVSLDLVNGLNCGRILRNEKVTHKDLSLKYEFPFMVAVCFSYLVIFFIECAILNGKIISYES